MIGPPWVSSAGSVEGVGGGMVLREETETSEGLNFRDPVGEDEEDIVLALR